MWNGSSGVRPRVKFAIAIDAADFAIRPDELARAVDGRSFESLFFTENPHIPATAPGIQQGAW
ncbi:MAG: hypothetical protein JOY58_18280 [Solirubrobacterales bacterium]|nr:hypothetical protein [Solirubrobacterales bacterium]MBV9050221.1 hypothetical protein [Solirubrobacterales bacterium]